ncbi:uncharacterized protein [Euphorbia lathyris]|uniref:uncharacterized protein n=1 Tax=Euphorbia lathyris TaxID=212925 RepID=UPI0033139EB5
MDTRSSSASTSPEFEFWMVRNPSIPPPNLVSADELFVDGILLPLQFLHLQNQSPKPPPDPQPPQPHSPEIPSNQTHIPAAASKRWTDIFKKSTPTTPTTKSQEDRDDKLDYKEKLEKKKERKSQTGATSAAELNINIWPFSRSRSAGNSGARPRMFPTARKVNSAPCSRSNSAGDSKSRKWPSSPGRPGVHLGRSSPVWQVRRGSAAKTSSSEFTSKKESRRTSSSSGSGGGVNSKTSEVVNLDGPMCIGYRQHLSCRSDEDVSSGRNGSAAPGNSSGNTLFNLHLRSIFSKKVY